MIMLQHALQYIVERRPGITDRQLTEAIYGNDLRHQQVNSEARYLASLGYTDRRKRPDGLIGNYIRQMCAA